MKLRKAKQRPWHSPGAIRGLPVPTFADEAGTELAWALSEDESGPDSGVIPLPVLIILVPVIVVLVGVVLLLAAVAFLVYLPIQLLLPSGRRKLRAKRLGMKHRLTVELEANPVAPGETVNAALVAPRPGNPEHTVVKLICEEEAEYQQGTSTYTDNHITLEHTVAEFHTATGGTAQRVTRFNFDVPENAMHSFYASNNRVEWRLEVERHFSNAAPVKDRGVFQVLPLALLTEVVEERLRTPPPDTPDGPHPPTPQPLGEPEQAARNPYRNDPNSFKDYR